MIQWSGTANRLGCHRSNGGLVSQFLPGHYVEELQVGRVFPAVEDEKSIECVRIYLSEALAKVSITQSSIRYFTQVHSDSHFALLRGLLLGSTVGGTAGGAGGYCVYKYRAKSSARTEPADVGGEQQHVPVCVCLPWKVQIKDGIVQVKVKVQSS